MTLPPGTASGNQLLQQVAADIARRKQEETHRIVVQQSVLQRVEAFAALYEAPDTMSATGVVGAAASASGSSAADAVSAVAPAIPPGLLVQALVIPGEKTSQGLIIEAVAVPWFEIVNLMLRDQRAIYELNWRQWEELVAGAYRELGYEVELTGGSRDHGRDIVATLPGFLSIRIFDQVKRFDPHRVVRAEVVDAMIGTLEKYGSVSKGIITTTSRFAPGILKDERVQRYRPHRLELRAKDDTLAWLREVASKHNN